WSTSPVRFSRPEWKRSSWWPLSFSPQCAVRLGPRLEGLGSEGLGLESLGLEGRHSTRPPGKEWRGVDGCRRAAAQNLQTNPQILGNSDKRSAKEAGKVQP